MDDDVSSDVDDAYLVQRAQEGYLDAFDLLVQRHAGLAYRVALRILGDHHDAQDVAQDALTRRGRVCRGSAATPASRPGCTASSPAKPSTAPPAARPATPWICSRTSATPPTDPASKPNATRPSTLSPPRSSAASRPTHRHRAAPLRRPVLRAGRHDHGQQRSRGAKPPFSRSAGTCRHTRAVEVILR